MVFAFDQRRFTKALRKVIAGFLVLFVSTSIIPPQNVHAQVLSLPLPGSRLSISQSFHPAVIKGIKIDPNNPLMFEFLIEPGQVPLDNHQKKEQYTKLIKYFLASLTTPEKDMWVNLSPYEHNRIISDNFGHTEMGRDMLAQDYLLKQLSASMVYPEDELGQRFWSKVYERVRLEKGNSEIPFNTLNKVWIVPQRATVFEKGNVAIVTESHLKVMMEQDYAAINKSRQSAVSQASEVVREIVLPAIETEINEGKNFAQLRQIYNSMILASWFKQRLKMHLLSKMYVNRDKNKGVELKDPNDNEQIFERYVQAYKKGVYNYIKEETDAKTGKMVPRKYFSGGFNPAMLAMDVSQGGVLTTVTNSSMLSNIAQDSFDCAAVELSPAISVIEDMLNKMGLFNEERFQSLRKSAKAIFEVVLKSGSFTDDQVGSLANLQYQQRRVISQAGTSEGDESYVREVLRTMLEAVQVSTIQEVKPVPEVRKESDVKKTLEVEKNTPVRREPEWRARLKPEDLEWNVGVGPLLRRREIRRMKIKLWLTAIVAAGVGGFTLFYSSGSSSEDNKDLKAGPKSVPVTETVGLLTAPSKKPDIKQEPVIVRNSVLNPLIVPYKINIPVEPIEVKRIESKPEVIEINNIQSGWYVEQNPKDIKSKVVTQKKVKPLKVKLVASKSSKINREAHAPIVYRQPAVKTPIVIHPGVRMSLYDFSKPLSDKEKAKASKKVAKALQSQIKTKGGIDFNDQYLQMNLQGNGDDFSIPPGFDWVLNMSISGFTPQILEIRSGVGIELSFFKGLLNNPT